MNNAHIARGMPISVHGHNFQMNIQKKEAGPGGTAPGKNETERQWLSDAWSEALFLGLEGTLQVRFAIDVSKGL